jgi:hypothetical protein
MMDRHFFERIARTVYGLWWVCLIVYMVMLAFGA